ncbi:BTAD domain-containing putative transcriptional regulator [Actinoplanes sp. CA-252034]|uniref:AfsR/SARP family transcriptional regulator n=1 Tax=Actinoplanes sp. CA-252034 TaxID=3239906 RepID=UPI003D969B10
MQFRVLGGLEVRRSDGEIVVMGRRKQRALLAVLLLRAGRVVRAGELTAALWGEDPPVSARANLHSYVSNLRRILDAAGGQTGGRKLTQAVGGYRLDVAEDEYDAMLFAALAAEGRQALREDQPLRAADRLGRALALWRGPPLEDLSDLEWFVPEAARLTEARLAALEDHARARLALGEHATLATELAPAVAEHPLRETLWIPYLHALHGSGARAKALTEYAALQATLRDELGVAPSGELQEAHLRLLSDDPAEQPATGLDRAVPAHLPPAVADFTGREEQLGQLSKVIPPGTDPAGLTVVGITGMAGVGKTTLAVHFAHSIAAFYPDGQLYADLAGTDLFPPTPTEVLGRFLRALGVPGPAVPPDAGERAELYRSRLAGRRVLVVLDNAASEQQVEALLPGGAGCAVLLTSRRWLPGLAGVRWTQLDVLGGDEGVRLLARILPDTRVDGDPRAAADLVRLCDGLPLAVRIAGARLTSRPQWTLSHLVALLRDEQGRLDRLHIGDLHVRASLTLSYQGLPPTARLLFRLLGAFDVPDFPGWLAGVLSDPAGDDLDTLVDTLVDTHLLTPVGIDAVGQARYRFHDLVRLFARDRARAEDPPERLRAAVSRGAGAWIAVAERLSDRMPGTCFASIPGRVPRPDVEQVVNTLAEKDPLAWFDAEQLAMQALIRQACETGDDEAAFDLAQRMEKYFDVRGMYTEWETCSRLALDACRVAGNRRGEAVVRRGLADLTTWVTEDHSGEAMARSYAEAERVEELFREAGEVGGMADTAVMRSWSLTATGRHGEALEVAGVALERAMWAGHLGGQARAHLALAVASGESGRLMEAVGHLHDALRCARELGNPRWVATALQFLGIAHGRAGQFEESGRYLAEALAISQQHQDTYTLILTMIVKARVAMGSGDDTAGPTARAALAAAREYRMTHHVAESLDVLGEIELNAGHSAEAAVHLRESVGLWRTRGWLRFQAQALVLLGRALSDHEGEAALAEAADLFTRLGDTGGAAEADRLLVTLRRRSG